ncbi:septal ring lytic transglycosylase RlpA family protein [Desulfogranum japonicum]|uniref:septal ring lytic transglycosylase RlpA family protein n=1 Tax=Desulfogranum japonicum TaxID=231447 RepID=UPI00041A73AC|nr:septal ring lytic transglycosylase RlpA family protein [Desulfogranum japonicum]
MTQKIVPFVLVILLGSIFPGCSSKAPISHKAPAKKQESRKYSRATQRPYVIKGVKYYPIPSAEGFREKGYASWYGGKFHGRKTANGETYDMYGETAAHKTLPMGTILLVKNLRTNKSCTVRVNDRGPFVNDRIIDLTYTAADQIDMIGPGTDPVEIIAMSTKKYAPSKSRQDEDAPPSPTNRFERGNFYVQTGAFVKLENARKLAHNFADKGRDVIIQQYPAAGMNLYRVLVYAGNTLTKAKAFEQHLEQNGFPYALVLAR